MNGSIADIRTRVRETIATATGEEVYQDIVPEGSEAGYLVELKNIGLDAQTIDGGQAMIPCEVDVMCYSYNTRQESDELADKIIGLLNNKSSTFFRRIRLTGITSLAYIDGEGVFVDLLSFEFVVKANGV